LQRYFETRFAVGDRGIAEFLQNRNNWEIVNAIMDAGVRGTTSKQLAEQLDINCKVVTEITRHLAQMEWTTSESPKRKLGRPRKETQRPKLLDFRKPSLVHVWASLDSFEPQLDEEFRDYCAKILDNHVDAFGEFLAALDRIVAEMKQSKFYPREPVHDCGWSHDGYEFIKALLYEVVAWLESNARFQAVMKKYELATDAAFEDLRRT
jgi:hypothetical protein